MFDVIAICNSVCVCMVVVIEDSRYNKLIKELKSLLVSIYTHCINSVCVCVCVLLLNPVQLHLVD